MTRQYSPLLQPVRIGLARWLAGFYSEFVPDTAQAAEWAARGSIKAMALVPGRMIDKAEEMVSAWRRQDNNDGAPSTSAFIPAVLLAMAHDYEQAPVEAGRNVQDWTSFIFPNDPGERVFQARTTASVIRAQVAVIASEPDTAHSILSQLCEYARSTSRFKTTYTFAGLTSQWPAMVEQSERQSIPTEVNDRIVVLTLDLRVKATLPMFRAPGAGDAADPGYPVVGELTVSALSKPAQELASGGGASDIFLGDLS